MRNLVRKASKSIKAKVWRVMKRARIDKLKERVQLMNSLVKAGLLYGVEKWGWKRKEGMKKLQRRHNKLALGVARNTLNYIWKLKAGRRSIEIEARRRVRDCLIQILRMKERRWLQICLTE